MLGCVRRREVTIQANLQRSFIQSVLCAKELMMRVGVRKEADDDFAVFDGASLAIVKGIAQGLQKMQRTLVAAGVAIIADDSEDAMSGTP